MILPFSTQLNGKATYFVEKISKTIKSLLFAKNPPAGFGSEFIPENFCYVQYAYCKPKLHTIREDKKDRWKVGAKIDFFINCRQKDMFRFAPVLPVISIQKVEIYHNAQSMWNDTIARPTIYIDGYDLHPDKIRQLAQNDGFDTIEDFFAYFNKDYVGKLIHWTDLRY